MEELIKRAEKMCLEKYQVVAKIKFRPQGYELGIDEPIYYKAQAEMFRDIKKIIGDFNCTELYVL